MEAEHPHNVPPTTKISAGVFKTKDDFTTRVPDTAHCLLICNTAVYNDDPTCKDHRTWQNCDFNLEAEAMKSLHCTLSCDDTYYTVYVSSFIKLYREDRYEQDKRKFTDLQRGNQACHNKQ